PRVVPAERQSVLVLESAKGRGGPGGPGRAGRAGPGGREELPPSRRRASPSRAPALVAAPSARTVVERGAPPRRCAVGRTRTRGAERSSRDERVDALAGERPAAARGLRGRGAWNGVRCHAGTSCNM